MDAGEWYIGIEAVKQKEMRSLIWVVLEIYFGLSLEAVSAV